VLAAARLALRRGMPEFLSIGEMQTAVEFGQQPFDALFSLAARRIQYHFRASAGWRLAQACVRIQRAWRLWRERTPATDRSKDRWHTEAAVFRAVLADDAEALRTLLYSRV